MITIIKAQAEDANELLKVKINAFKQEVDLYGSGPPGYDDIKKEIVPIKAGNYFKIMNEGKIIGGIITDNKSIGNYYIRGLFIDLEFQNRGIGTLAMNFLEKEFPNAKKWSLETPHLSFRNHHFYEKMGFLKVGETKPDPQNNNFSLFLYEKVNV